MAKGTTQEHPMGCGVACTAHLLKISYQKALRLFDHPENAWAKGFFCKDIIKVLETRTGQPYACVYAPKYKPKFSPGTIVFIEKSKKYPMGHYLIKTSDGWMNPWINFPVIKPARSGIMPRLPAKALYAILRTAK